MDNTELGKRLKTARLSRKMTQSEVAGTFITRNMLSLIESGSATPSMKTLEYLTEVLEIPMEKLLSDSWEESSEIPDFQTLKNAKKLLTDKQYVQILENIKAEGLFTDELHAIRSIAHLETAELLSESGQAELLQKALNHARSAAEEASQGIYANQARIAQANQIIADSAQSLSNYYSSLAQGKFS
ncbi:MAG: helix-turn-helix transcriptional regulator [Oscillospiraceae bacterium]|nr:helix-turn-helix transcriptional regulator [Oscillospiraceae bacterium]MBR7085287.1 helix-turn-helix transcriptional regulator [Oscillospiraceae bacterium]